MAEKRKKSKYQMKLRARKTLANRLGGAYHTGTDGKRLPFALPVLLAIKTELEAEGIKNILSKVTKNNEEELPLMDKEYKNLSVDEI